ncbi:response regulator [Aquabacterium sp.]|uniref:response regulator n=1 Tax=Aquabacterium sp. TaxID=1872578 RepID=UPI0037852CE0
MSQGAPVQTLVVEDDEAIRQMLRTTLEAEGHRVHTARSLREGLTLAGNRRLDLFIVDLGLPDGDGLQLIHALRKWTSRPVLVLSARTDETQKVQALDAGADDYVTKPFGVAELHARVRVALRHAARPARLASTLLRCGAVSIDLGTKRVQRGAEELKLTATQWRLLEVLARHAGRVVTADRLLAEVWGPSHAEQRHYLRIYVRQLRQKLEQDPARPRYLLNDTGIGYRLMTDEEVGGAPS